MSVPDFSWGTPLHDAAAAGDVQAVRRVLQANPASVHARGLGGRTALHLAAEGGHPEVARLIVDGGADPAMRDDAGATPLHAAASAPRHSAELFAALAPWLVSVDPIDNDGHTPLHHAASAGNVDLIRSLLMAGADVRAAAADGMTPLHYALWPDHVEATRLRRGGRVPLRAGRLYDFTRPRDDARRADALAALDALLGHGADATAADADGLTPLHLATAATHVARLADAGAACDATGEGGLMPTHVAASIGSVEVLRALRQRGAALEPSAPPVGQRYPMAAELDAGGFLSGLKEGAPFGGGGGGGGAGAPVHHAAYHGNLNVLAALRDLGCRLDTRGPGGLTPLHVAAFAGRAEAVAWLLDRGANVRARDDASNTALHWASTEPSAGAAALLLDRGLRVGGRNGSGETPLHRAARWREVEMVRLLLERGASVRARAGADGGAPLHYAAQGGSAEVVALLLGAGARAGARDGQGRTPLFRLTDLGRGLDAHRRLLAAGVRTDARDHVGNTALHEAWRWGRGDIVALLIAAGANRRRRNHAGETAAELAAAHGIPLVDPADAALGEDAASLAALGEQLSRLRLRLPSEDDLPDQG